MGVPVRTGTVLLLCWVVTVGLVAAATASSTDDAPDSTVEAERRDLVRPLLFQGRVGHGPARPVPVGSAEGTLTAVAAIGTVVDEGDEIARIDDRPVLVVAGAVPVHRALGTGVPAGADVEQLERTLVRLGHATVGEGMPDRTFSAATERALRLWQEEVGAVVDGRLDLGDFVALPTPVLVAGHPTTLGWTVDGPIVAVTGIERLVTVVTDADRATPLRPGRSATVGLPDGTTSDAVVVEVVDRPGTRDDGGEQPGSPQRVVTLTVEDDLDPTASAATVSVDEVRVEDVVAVPVQAVLATADGFVVERWADGTTTTVPVELGEVVGGWAEIRRGVAAGDAVVVP